MVVLEHATESLTAFDPASDELEIGQCSVSTGEIKGAIRETPRSPEPGVLSSAEFFEPTAGNAPVSQFDFRDCLR